MAVFVTIAKGTTVHLDLSQVPVYYVDLHAFQMERFCAISPFVFSVCSVSHVSVKNNAKRALCAEVVEKKCAELMLHLTTCFSLAYSWSEGMKLMIRCFALPYV